MKNPSRSHRFARSPGGLLLSLGCLVLPLAGRAQTDQTPAAPEASAAPSGSSANAPAPVKLDPFEVQADSDKSYGALNSNSITRFNVELNKLPISADIFNEAFMNDTDSTTVEDMIRTYSAGAGYQAADPGSNSYDNQPGDRVGGASLSLRGLQSTESVRDGLMPVGSFGSAGSTGTGTTSNFDVERVEIINGPQALLYGSGGGGGVINLVSKQARLGAPAFGETKFQVDQYGNKLGQFDYGVGTDSVAVRVAAIDQTIGGRRLFVGGPMDGMYAQGAVRAFGNTTVRVTFERTAFTRLNNSNNSIVTSSTSFDSRNGDALHYLLATNQIQAANSGTSGAGPIDNGLVNWANVDSWEGWDQSEVTDDEFADLTAETQWNTWLSSQLSVGYNNLKQDQDTAGFTFNAPSVTTNPLGVWAAAQIPSDTELPARTKAIRFSVLATNDLFGGRANSQSILGADFVRTDTADIVYQYFQADSNFNVLVNPAVTAANGRTVMPKLYWSLANGPVEYPNFRPATAQVTVGGVNYVRMIENPVSPSQISAADPLGVTLGGSAYTLSNIVNKGIYGVNYTQWLGGKLDTLAGFRLAFSHEGDLNAGAAPPSISSVEKIAESNSLSFNVGADYAVLPWLRPYFSVSDSYDPPASQTDDPLANQPPTAHALGEEIGFKLQNADSSISGSVALYHVASDNEQYEITSSIENDINPSGLNGRYGAAGNFIPVNRESQGLQASLTASPTPNWRLRLSAAVTNGKIDSTTNYNQVYNDSFHENSSGQVTYADGTVVFVNPTYNSKQLTVTSSTAGAIPLTALAMSTPSNSYFAAPLAVNGQISSSSPAAKVLSVVDPVHGAILTGITGLPISQIQINPTLAGVTIPGTITTSQSGDVATGYPELAANLTSIYTFSSGWLKGFRAGGSVLGSWYNRTNYYYTDGAPAPGATRTLFAMPNTIRFDAIVGYEKKLKRVTWSAQLNIENIFNNYEVVLLPNGATGWIPNGVNATFTQQPRDYVAQTTLKF